MWVERYEDVLSDGFELRERITRPVVGSLVLELEAEGCGGSSSAPDAGSPRRTSRRGAKAGPDIARS